MSLPIFRDGGYRYLPAVFQYSGGVAAEPGFEIVRLRLARPLPLAEGLAVAAARLQARGRPLAAFCACELRSPAPFSERGFLEFNRAYAAVLERWGIVRDGVNPVARTNVCPAFEPPAEPLLYAFSYTVPGARPGFVIAGGGEVPEGKPNYRDFIVRRGDASPEGLREKVGYVMDAMQARLAALGFGWADALAVQAYTVRDLGPLLYDEIVRRGAAAGGLTWHYARPPVEGLEYEMDLRAPVREGVI